MPSAPASLPSISETREAIPCVGAPSSAASVVESAYRPDIDVLRAFAVLAVLCFHWEIYPFSGGFVGVDVFFVISGFLITQLIVSEIEGGRFSFVRFYERRIRRILPALYTVIAAVFLTAWFLLLPPQVTDLARSVVAVTGLVSNILFWQQTGYFDGPATNKPLLHTWSLAVEEQFYLVFPALMLLLFLPRLLRHKGVVGLSPATFALVLIWIVSFAYNAWQVKHAPSSAFYLAPGRAWEFLCGSILVVGRTPPIANSLARFAVLATSLVMLAIAALGYSPKTSFPGVAALLPCIGTALCIWAGSGRKAGALESALTSLPLFYGRLSYSLYLWHWPMWVFAKLLMRPAAVEAPLKIGMFALATVLAYLSYRLVEQPFRRRPALVSRQLLFVSAGATSVLVVSMGIVGMATDGFPGRIAPQIAAIAAYERYPRGPFYREGVCFLRLDQKIEEYDVANCFSPIKGTRNVLLWGDSVMSHYLPGLQRATQGLNVQLLQASASSCPPFVGLSQPVLPNCEPLNNFVNDRLRTNPPDVVIISGNWEYYSTVLGHARFLDLLRQTIAMVTSYRLPIAVIGPAIQYDESLPALLVSRALRGIDLSQPGKLTKPGIFDLDRRMAADLTGLSGVTYVSVLMANCPERECPMVTGDRIPMQWDAIHLTVPGSERVIKAVMPQMAPLLFGR
jgi:peptidoglycan/LPS O-acetylase OafA/YrhL